MKSKDPFQEKKNAQKVDRSKKGSIDRRISSLCDCLNADDNFYTTSSCSGRIILIDKGNGKKCDSEWLLASHEKVSLNEVKEALKKISCSPVWFKMEPFIIHVCARHFEDAENLLEAARRCGLKRAGIISLSGRIILEIIGTEFIETIIADDGEMLADESYLKALVDEANKKMDINFDKLEKFEEEVKGMLAKYES